MEEVSGDALNTVIDQILSLQSRLLRCGIELGGYDSLYFAEDVIALGLSKQLSVVMEKSLARFCLGPLAYHDFLVARHRRKM